MVTAMSDLTKADILKAAAIERMIHEARPAPSTIFIPPSWWDMKNVAFLRMELLERIAKDMPDD